MKIKKYSSYTNKSNGKDGVELKNDSILTEEMLKSSILNDKWIFHRYKIDLLKPEDLAHEEFLLHCETNLKHKVLSVVTVQMVGADSYKVRRGIFRKDLIYKKSIQKNPTVQVIFDEDNNYCILIRFVDTTEKSDERTYKAIEQGEPLIWDKHPDEEREYNFSPLQMLKSIPIIQNIEFGLITLFNAKQHEFSCLFHYDEDNNPIITETDGIGLHTYPFKKRVKLYSKYPKFDKLLFGWEFKDYVNWILEKKYVDEYNKKYCLKIEKILDRHNINFKK